MPKAIDFYRKAQGRFMLPHFEKLQSTFQLTINEDDSIHDIQNEISDHIFDFAERVIEPLLWSSQGMNMIEREMMTSDEEARVFEMYKELQSLKWRHNLLTVKPNEEDAMKWISDMWKFWEKHQPLTENLCIKFSGSWKKLKFEEVSTEYQG